MAKFVTEAGVVIETITRLLHNHSPIVIGALAIKGVIWAARAQRPKPGPVTAQPHLEAPNVIIPTVHGDQEAEDFLGPDIDIGFRLGPHVAANVLAVSAELAFILLDHEDSMGLSGRLRIVGYKQLKGVWRGRPYPIIWYCADWEAIRQILPYDAVLQSDLAKTAVESPAQVSETLPLIMQQIGLGQFPGEFRSSMKAPEPETELRYTSISRAKLAEVHCVAIVFDTSMRVLAARRPMDKERMPGIWEFGCAQIRSTHTVEDCLKEAYLEDFGAKIEVVNQPIACYHILVEQTGKVIPGFIFPAFLKNESEDIKTALHPKKHSELNWVPVDEIERLSVDEWVPDARANIQAAYRAIQEHHAQISPPLQQ